MAIHPKSRIVAGATIRRPIVSVFDLAIALFQFQPVLSVRRSILLNASEVPRQEIAMPRRALGLFEMTGLGHFTNSEVLHIAERLIHGRVA